MSPPLHYFVLARVVALLCLAACIPPAKAQTPEVMIRATGHMVPVCKLADLDSNVSFFNADTYFAVAFDLQNISQSPCVPQPSVSFPQFDLEQVQETKPFGLCTDCEDRLPNGQYRVHDPVVLNPGDIAHQTYQWKTVAPPDTVKCLRVRALFAPVLVVAPTLFKQVCSEIAVSRTYAGAFVPPDLKDKPHLDEEQIGEVFALSSSKPRYYQDEMFTLHVALANPAFEPLSGDDECPTLFLREKSPDGSTRFDEVPPSGFKTCKSFSWGANRNADWQSGFEVDSGVRSSWGGIGEHSFELFQPVSSSLQGRIRFHGSNKFTVQIDDPAVIARKWDGKEKGVGVDVTLDKLSYRLGENVPLHIAIENFDASVPIYATDPLWDPYEAIGIEVRDARGRLLQESERFSTAAIWTGHGRGPTPFLPGKLVTIERTLASQGWLPNRPGVYSVVVTWRPLDGTKFEPGPGLPRTDDIRIYATVHAAATFRIDGDPSPASQSQP
ncbi:MAG TPA: hypothetical protein VI431_06995 [Candidatus Acidoferrum sp.]